MKKIVLALASVLFVVFGLIALNMSSNASEKHLDYHWEIASHVQSGRHLFPLYKMNGNLWKTGSGVRRTTKRICFGQRFRHVPKVSVSLYELDVVRDRNLRVNTWVSHVGRKCFTLHFQTWADTHIWSAGVSWIATAKI